MTTDILDQVDLCTQCEECLDICPTYQVTKNNFLSPMRRLETAASIFRGDKSTTEEINSVYSCLKCEACNVVCPQEIDIAKIMRKSQTELIKRRQGPFEKINEMVEGNLKLGNTVNGDPNRRLEWLPEEFVPRESDTLLYMGCMPSYITKDYATSTYLTLKKLGVDFMILEDEGCCGAFTYELGRVDLAPEMFEKNVERFKRLGIKRVITGCVGCYHCFNKYYKETIGQVNFEVLHVTQVLPDLLKQKSIKLKDQKVKVTCLDSCASGRMEGIYEEPRDALKACGYEIEEMKENRENAPCCGAGGGVRTFYRELSMDMGNRTLDMAKTDTIVATCPTCIFHLNYISRKREKGKKVVSVTELVLNSLDSI